MNLIILFDIFTFVFGVCIGSFLNCAIYRLEQKKKMNGRSFCPHCKHLLSWYDLFPVFSFLFLGGKCRYCSKKISIQYPLVELATGIIFLLVYSFQPVSSRFPILEFLNLAFLFYISSALIVIFIYDLKHYIIPDKVLLPAVVITFLYRVLDLGLFGNPTTIFDFVLAAVIASGFFLAIFLISKGKWMGFGDVKLAVLMGFFLGLSNVLVALFLAFFFGAIIGIMLMALKKKGLKSEIPFGPFLILGTFVALLYGNQIIQWYLQLFSI